MISTLRETISNENLRKGLSATKLEKEIRKAVTIMLLKDLKLFNHLYTSSNYISNEYFF